MSFSTGLQSKIIRIWDAASITGLSDGETITTWTDSVVGDVATLATGNTLPFYTYRTNVFGTRPAVQITIDQQWYNGLGAVFLQPSSTINNVYGVFGLVQADTSLFPSVIGTMSGITDFVTNAGGDSTIGIDVRDNSQGSFICYEDGVKVGSALNRRPYPTVMGAVLPSGGSVSILGGASVRAFNGYISSIVLLNAAPTDAEALELSTYLNGLASLTPHPHPTQMMLFFGDSLTSEDASSTPADQNSTYPGLVARYEGLSNLTWQNFGWYGCETSNVLAVAQNQGTTTIVAAVAAGYTDITCVVFIGCNNIYSGASPSAAASDVQSICTTLRSAGATKIILCTLTARNGSDPSMQATYVANAATYNAALVGMVPSYADAIVRLDQDPEMGPDGSQLNPTYFVSDHTHFTVAGITRVASAVEAQGLYTPSSSSSSSSKSSASSQSSLSSRSSESSSSSSGSGAILLVMDQNPHQNIPPVVLVNGKDPGPISQIDQMTYKYINVLVQRAPVTVELVSPYANSEIRYETNGKNPANNSKLYNGPLVFRQNFSGSDRTVIKARIYSTKNSNVKGRIIRLEFNVV